MLQPSSARKRSPYGYVIPLWSVQPVRAEKDLLWLQKVVKGVNYLPPQFGLPLTPSLWGRPVAVSTHQQKPVEEWHWISEKLPSLSHLGTNAPIREVSTWRNIAEQRGVAGFPGRQVRPHPLLQHSLPSSPQSSLLEQASTHIPTRPVALGHCLGITSG